MGAINQNLRSAVARALAGQRPASRANLLMRYKPEISLGPDFVAYYNPRVTATVSETASFEVTHLQFISLAELGHVIIVPAREGDEGAEPFTRRGSRRTGTVNMRAALNDFNLDFSVRRKLRFPIQAVEVEVPAPDGGAAAPGTVVLMRVKDPGSQRRRTRARKQAAPSQAAPAAAAPAQAAETAAATAAPAAATAAPAAQPGT